MSDQPETPAPVETPAEAPTEETPKKSTKRTRLRRFIRWFLITALVCVLAIVGLGIWAQWRYDDALRAWRGENLPATFAELDMPEVPVARNAVPPFERAIAAMKEQPGLVSLLDEMLADLTPDNSDAAESAQTQPGAAAATEVVPYWPPADAAFWFQLESALPLWQTPLEFADIAAGRPEAAFGWDETSWLHMTGGVIQDQVMIARLLHVRSMLRLHQLRLCLATPPPLGSDPEQARADWIEAWLAELSLSRIHRNDPFLLQILLDNAATNLALDGLRIALTLDVPFTTSERTRITEALLLQDSLTTEAWWHGLRGEQCWQITVLGHPEVARQLFDDTGDQYWLLRTPVGRAYMLSNAAELMERMIGCTPTVPEENLHNLVDAVGTAIAGLDQLNSWYTLVLTVFPDLRGVLASTLGVKSDLRAAAYLVTAPEDRDESLPVDARTGMPMRLQAIGDWQCLVPSSDAWMQDTMWHPWPLAPVSE